ncbi:MAG: dihydropteroate synthase [Candidatus Omnitrophica bacterium]|nr:dihydropteroate synthase [Candidatus Omnitrophota bacterium]
MAVREAATTFHPKIRCVSVSPEISHPARPLRLGAQRRPLVMGVLNVTPDSFSDGGRWLDPGAAVERGIRMEAEGADLIDVGGESTRPGAAPVPVQEELRRTIPVIAGLVRAVRIPLSIDTSKAEVARRAIEAGASLINDVTALRGDPDMGKVAARGRVPIILMHMRGIPRTMQRRPRYGDVVQEVAAFLLRAAEGAQAAGIARSRILLDPGLGFGKTLAHNLALLRGLPRLVSLGFPIALGPSRKSFIGAVLQTDVGDRLAGTLACVAHAQRCGAHIVRVHDVQPAVQLLRMLAAIDKRGRGDSSD